MLARTVQITIISTNRLQMTDDTIPSTGRIGIVNYKPGEGGPGPVARLGEGERVAQAAVEADIASAGLTLRPVPQFLRYQYLVIATRPDGKTR